MFGLGGLERGGGKEEGVRSAHHSARKGLRGEQGVIGKKGSGKVRWRWGGWG